MRVLTRPNVGGPTRQAVALWHELAKLGWRTLLVVGRCDDEPAVDLAGAGIPEVLPDAADRDSAGFVVVPTLRRGLDPLRDVLARWRLGALMRAFAPDVVHTHTSKAGALARPAARANDVAVVAHTFHGHVLRDYFGRWRSALVRRVERRLARRTELLFAVSPSCKEELVALGVAPAERIEVLPPAVDTTAFAGGSRARARAELGLDPDTFVLGFVGRLVPVKRPGWFADVVARIPDALGLMFGDGPLRNDLAGAARVRVLGASERLAELLPACDVLVFTSVREGCPLAAVEAFAAGVPVVGLSVPGVRDVLGEWGHGVLVAETAGIDGLVAACAELRSAERRAAVSEAARAAVSRFAPAAVARQLARAYEQRLLDASQRRERRWFRRRARASWIDVVLVVPLGIGGLLTTITPFVEVVERTADVYVWQHLEAGGIGALIVIVSLWRACVLPDGWVQQSMRLALSCAYVGLLVRLWFTLLRVA